MLDPFICNFVNLSVTCGYNGTCDGPKSYLSVNQDSECDLQIADRGFGEDVVNIILNDLSVHDLYVCVYACIYVCLYVCMFYACMYDSTETDLFYQETATHIYLSPSGCHHRHVFRYITYRGQLWIQHICSKPEWVDLNHSKFHQYLPHRGYKVKIV